MILEKYWELLREINALYEAGKFIEVIEFLESTEMKFPYGKASLFYYGICAATKLGKGYYEVAIQFLKQIIDGGGWYTEYILTQSPSLQPLQNIAEFKIQLQRSREISTQALKENHDVTVIPKEGTSSYPLMLALHADSGVIEEEIDFWKPATDKGYILGMPRCTNVHWSGKDSAYWPDHETATDQIKSYIETINSIHPINFDQTVIGGLSSGAELAIWLALSKTVPACKFVAVAPGGQWMNELEKWQTLIDEESHHNLTGLIILGKEDKVVSHENIRILVKMLNDSGISCQLHESPNVGHWYPPDFTNRLSSFL
ncbi:MAG: hypothetical protein KAT16_03560 [Candidatus Heimdallarchaeota archaeon]|nr:hypothetical protein [Candidatus Heimdallarchaeota archaeon]